MSAAHPSYPSPTIAQVTCEIAFSSENETKLSAATLYQIFGAEFPEMQPIATSFQVLVLQQPFAVNQDRLQSPNAGAFRFATPDGKRFVQLSKTNFVYQSNERYPGWETVRTKIMELWAAAHLVPTTIVKVGTRYINRIVKTEAHPNLSDWLRPTADLPAALIGSKDHFLGRIETSPAPSHLKIVTLANEPPGPDWPLGSIVLDIDRITTEPFDATEPNILRNLNLLHEDVWTCFDSATTKTLRARLNQES